MTSLSAMNYILMLPGGLENDFWTSSFVVKQLALVDFAGVALALVTNTGAAIAMKTPMACFLYFMAAILQALQLLWMSCSSRSYFSHRNMVTLLQRLRGLLFCLPIGIGIATQSHMLHPFCAQVLANPQHGWLRTASIVLMTPTAFLMSALYHPVPFAYLLPVSIITLCVDIYGYHHHKMVLLQAVNAQPLLGKACSTLSAILASPTLDTPHRINFCEAHAITVVPAFVFVVVAILLPLHLTYWQEMSAKQVYLQRLQDSSCSSESSNAETSNGVRFISFMVWTAAAWSTICLWAYLS